MTKLPLLLRVGLGVYRLLLAFWPSSSRERYEGEMVDLLKRDLGRRQERDGRLPAT